MSSSKEAADNIVKNLRIGVEYGHGDRSFFIKGNIQPDEHLAEQDLEMFRCAIETHLKERDDRIAALEAELKRVREAKADELAAAAEIIKMEYTPINGTEIQVASPLAKVMTQWAMADFEQSGATNFVERSIEVGGGDGPRFVLTIQKQEGKTPGQIVGEHRKQIESLKAELREVRKKQAAQPE